MPEASLIRAFVALEISEELRGRLADVIKELRKTPARVSWVRPENMHLTMAFLGPIPATRVDDLVELMNRRCEPLEPFSYTVQGLGCFGSKRKPRVVWAGIPSVPPAMEQIHRCGLRMAKKAGILVRERSFSPHITVGRVRSSEEVAELTSVITSYKNREFGVTHVKRVLFMQSKLSPQGARYSVLHESHLKGVNTHAT